MSYEFLINLIKNFQNIIAQTAIENKTFNSPLHPILKELNSAIVNNIMLYLQTGSSLEWNNFISNSVQEQRGNGLNGDAILKQVELVTEKIRGLIEQSNSSVAQTEKSKYLFRLQGLMTMSRISIIIADTGNRIPTSRKSLP